VRIGFRAIFAASKVCIALLLGVVPLTVMIPGSGMAFGQSGTGSQVPLYTLGA